jgi:hypothetical protein
MALLLKSGGIIVRNRVMTLTEFYQQNSWTGTKPVVNSTDFRLPRFTDDSRIRAHAGV